jgi:hypothetical protein
MNPGVFYGVSHVDVPVTALDRSLRVYANATGFPVQARGAGWAEVFAGALAIRLVEAREIDHRASIRLQSPEVEAGVAALVEAGASPLRAPTRNPANELVGSVCDPDGHTISVWRALSEDELDEVPPLPTQLTWDADAEELLKSLLKRVPVLFRVIARYRVTRVAETLAACTKRVTREEVIRGYILASPRVTRGRNRQPLIDHGIDVDRYRDDWEAD